LNYVNWIKRSWHKSMLSKTKYLYVKKWFTSNAFIQSKHNVAEKKKTKHPKGYDLNTFHFYERQQNGFNLKPIKLFKVPIYKAISFLPLLLLFLLIMLFLSLLFFDYFSFHSAFTFGKINIYINSSFVFFIFFFFPFSLLFSKWPEEMLSSKIQKKKLQKKSKDVKNETKKDRKCITFFRNHDTINTCQNETANQREEKKFVTWLKGTK
jgi:hypothetical protein